MRFAGQMYHNPNSASQAAPVMFIIGSRAAIRDFQPGFCPRRLALIERSGMAYEQILDPGGSVWVGDMCGLQPDGPFTNCWPRHFLLRTIRPSGA